MAIAAPPHRHDTLGLAPGRRAPRAVPGLRPPEPSLPRTAGGPDPAGLPAAPCRRRRGRRHPHVDEMAAVASCGTRPVAHRRRRPLLVQNKLAPAGILTIDATRPPARRPATPHPAGAETAPAGAALPAGRGTTGGHGRWARLFGPLFRPAGRGGRPGRSGAPRRLALRRPRRRSAPSTMSPGRRR